MEKLSESKDVAEHKLLILYILEKLNIAIASIDLTNYILEERLMKFIPFQQHVHELVVTNHIISVADDGFTKYMITDSGAEVLSDMIDMIPLTEKHRVDRTVRKLNKHVINNRAVRAAFIPDNEHSGVVRLELNEGDFSVLLLEVSTASKEEARIICNNWKTRTADIYSGIVDLLLYTEQAEQVDPEDHNDPDDP